MNHLFCFGLGYTALALVDRLVLEGWEVSGTARGAEGTEAAAARGIALRTFDRAHPLADPAGTLADATHLLSSVPPDADGDAVLACHGGDLAAAPRKMSSLGSAPSPGSRSRQAR